MTPPPYLEFDKPSKKPTQPKLEGGESATANNQFNFPIKGSVGKGGKNNFEDVKAVQKLLLQAGAPNIKVTGLMDPATENAILNFNMTYGKNIIYLFLMVKMFIMSKLIKK